VKANLAGIPWEAFLNSSAGAEFQETCFSFVPAGMQFSKEQGNDLIQLHTPA